MSDIDTLLAARVTKAMYTTAGDILVASGASTPTRLPVGTNNQVLTVVGGAPAWAGSSSSATPGTELDYARIITDSVGITATTEATATVFITGNSITYDGTRVKVEVFVPKWSQSAALTPVLVFLRDSTVLGQVNVQTSGMASIKAETFDTPAAGAHTYKVAAFVGSNTLTINAGPGGSGNLVPAFLRVTRA